MFDVGLSELALIALVGLIVIGPKDMPVVARYIMGAIRELKSFANGVRKQVEDIAEEAGLNDLKANTIIDLDGKPQIAYDISEIEDTSRTPKPKPEALANDTAE